MKAPIPIATISNQEERIAIVRGAQANIFAGVLESRASRGEEGTEEKERQERWYGAEHDDVFSSFDVAECDALTGVWCMSCATKKSIQTVSGDLMEGRGKQDRYLHLDTLHTAHSLSSSRSFGHATSGLFAT